MTKEQTPPSASRVERVLAYMVAGIIGLSLLAFITVIIGTWQGAHADGGFGEGAWPFIIMLPNVGLPLGFLLIVILLITSAVRRGRAAKGARE